jgi:hypothetical protein
MNDTLLFNIPGVDYSWATIKAHNTWDFVIFQAQIWIKNVKVMCEEKIHIASDGV